MPSYFDHLFSVCFGRTAMHSIRCGLLLQLRRGLSVSIFVRLLVMSKRSWLITVWKRTMRSKEWFIRQLKKSCALYRNEKTNTASNLERNDPLLLSNHLFYTFCITLLVKIEILKLVQRLIIPAWRSQTSSRPHFYSCSAMLPQWLLWCRVSLSVSLLQVSVLSKPLDRSSCFCYGGFLWRLLK